MSAPPCYICGAPSTSRDHAPPAVFFPEDKDLEPGGRSLRSNLFTFPACDAHNSQRSGADVLACFWILATLGTNDLARRQMATKVGRALERDGRLAVRLTKGGGPIQLDGQDSAILRPDHAAMTSVLEATTRGLYFRHVNRRLEGPLLWRSPTMRDSTLRLDENTTRVWRMMAEAPDELPSHERHDRYVGDPRVFRYDLWLHRVNRALFACRLWFYEGFAVLVVPARSTAR